MSSKRRLMSSSSSSSRECIGYNEGIMTEISLYLPVKSILRFRSVSKQWNSLLTHPLFIKRYATLKSTNSVLFFDFLRYPNIESFHLKGSNNNNLDMVDFGYICQDELSLVKSCNGLLLFEFNNYKVRGQAPRRKGFYVCNPFTRKYTKIAVLDSIATSPFVSSYLAFDPSKSPDYSVIFFWKGDYRSYDYEVAIYSSETRTCRKLSFTFDNTHCIWSSLGAFLNGEMYWLCEPLDITTSSMPYLDINQESIGEFPRPPYTTNGNRIMYFGECRGHLHLILRQGGWVGYTLLRVFDVYELNQDRSSWVFKYKVHLDDIAVDFPEIIFEIGSNSIMQCTYHNFLCVVEEDGKDPTVVLSFGKKIEAYNFIDKTTKMLCDISSPSGEEEDEDKSFYGCRTFLCNESLSGV